MRAGKESEMDPDVLIEAYWLALAKRLHALLGIPVLVCEIEMPIAEQLRRQLETPVTIDPLADLDVLGYEGGGWQVFVEGHGGREDTEFRPLRGTVLGRPHGFGLELQDGGWRAVAVCGSFMVEIQGEASRPRAWTSRRRRVTDAHVERTAPVV
jgi:hypothetical protein